MAYTYNAQGNTANYGDWNPQVAQLQQQLNAKGANLVVDGKFGPLTQQAQQQYGGQNRGTTTPGSTTGTPGANDSVGGIRDMLLNYYQVPQSVLDQIPDSALASYVGPVASYLQNLSANGQTVSGINSQNFLQAWQSATNDPDIAAKYGDSLKLDQAGLNQSLNFLNTMNNITEANNAIKFRTDTNTLNENSAQSGQAYSGFRGQAQKDLKTEQNGVIQSTRAKLQNDIFNTGSALEKAYGTNGLGQFGNIGAGGVNYQPVGGITGTVPKAKEQDIAQQAGSNYGLLTYPQ